MGETVTIVERRLRNRNSSFESVRGDDERAEAMLNRSDSLGGREVIGTLVTIHCVDSDDIPDGNIFGCCGCQVPGDTFAKEQLRQIVHE